MEELKILENCKLLGRRVQVWGGNGEVYMTRQQIGQALEYADPQKAIDNIHARYKARLDKFSVTLKLRATDGKYYDTMLYSAKGVYEICRRSEQPNADEFYDNVYDILESVRKKGYYSSIPAEQLIKQLKAEIKKDPDLTPITVYEKLTGKKLVDKKQLLKDQEAERRKWHKERAEEIRRWHAFTMSFDKLYTEIEKYAQDAGISKEAFQTIAAGLNPQACQEVDGVLMFNQLAVRLAMKELFRIRDERQAG